MERTIIIVLLLKISHCFAQSDGSFLIYNVQKNRCLGDNLQRLDYCNPQNTRQQYRWTSENRIFNVAQKKCLGVGSKSEGNKLQWYICDANSDLQKWECQSNSLFGLKNESLYLSTQRDSFLLTLTKEPGDQSKWTIHGTTDSVCSRPYEELYTIKGNAFGRPCHFPFSYKNKWYSGCTTDDAKYPWCATEREYEQNQLWGYCPTLPGVNELWKKNPLTNIYYQVNEDSALTWYQARKSCQQQGGDLVSITEPHEQTFVSGMTQKNGAVLWTGLNRLDASSGWHWINGQPLRYLKWLSGQPSFEPDHSCGVISQLHNSDWSTEVCSERNGYICQGGQSSPTVPPVVHTGSCYSPWIPYSGHCYFLNRSKRTWFEARDACRHEGGDLLSILSVEEQSFIISQLGYSKTDELWIGFNDLKTQMLFEWTDHSSVPFVLWDVNEPSHIAASKDDCVLMRGEEGKWADQICQNKYGYICKKNTHLKPATNDTVVTNPGCKPGWVRYGYYCYLAGSETKTFEEAKQMCEKTGSYLADISDRIENAFLVSLIGARPEKYFWIGLSNQKDRHTFEWTNTKKVSFTHFNAGMPGGKQGCVATTTGVLAGLWDVISCSNTEKYICKQIAEGVITTHAPPTTAAPTCSEGWIPITNRDFCFKHFSVEQKQTKTWYEALDFCREIGGDLLSIHSPVDLDSEDFKFSAPAWIGYSIQDPSVGYTWSDGSSSSYESWAEGEPNNLNNLEKCTSLQFSWWKTRHGQWNDLHCEDKMNWYCEIRKGVTPKEVNITEPTYNITDDGWIIFKDSQYYFSHGHTVSMDEGRQFCMHRHGDLVVINDEKERVFIWQQIKNLYSAAYIGMTLDLDKSVMWMDGSPVVFQAWAQNEPAFLNDEQQCTVMTTSQGVWKSVNCGDIYSFVCKRSISVPVNATVAPTEPPTGGCAPDWLTFQGKCYKVEEYQKTWTDARSYCRTLGGDLASITSRYHQAFFTLKMLEDGTSDLWTGLNNLAEGRFKWTDGSRVLFMHWRKGGAGTHLRDKTKCVVMRGSESINAGIWTIKHCNNTNGFICSRPLDHLIMPSPTEVPKTFVQLGNSSYMLIQKNLTWKEAQQRCNAEGANLASIRDIFTHYYVMLLAQKLGQPLWIGLNSMETGGYFLWIDNWHLSMEKWGIYEPKKNNPCVYVNELGWWTTAQCNQTTYGLCKKSSEVAPHPPIQYPGVCPEPTESEPEMTWVPYKGHCYAFVKSFIPWIAASDKCKESGAILASIQDPEEENFIQNGIHFVGKRSSFWIGLHKSLTGHWLWLDNSVVDYTNWEQSIDTEDHDYGEDFGHFFDQLSSCASISSDGPQWEKRNCNYHMTSFICKTAKVINSTPGTNHTGVAEPHRSYSVGVSVFVVIAVLTLLAVLAYVYHRTSKSQFAPPAIVNPMYYTTVSSLSEEKDTKNLMDQMEIPE